MLAFIFILATSHNMKTTIGTFVPVEEALSFPVNPPENITVSDLGLLGHLEIHWNRPASLRNITDCTVRYQVEVFSAYENRWKGIRTSQTSVRDQFDLEQAVQLKLKTIVKGKCTNGTELHSSTVHLEQSPQHTGHASTRVRDFDCVFHQKEYMECTWRAKEEPQHSQRNLFYWHRDLEKPMECPKYLESHGVRDGCWFPKEALLEYTEFNICINGTSPMGPLRPAFYSLQLQNHVKPGVVENVSLELGPEKVFRLEWSPPTGQIPCHCLEYQVEAQESNVWLVSNITEETTFTPQITSNGRSCFRIRSRMHKYCADRGVWSEWSPQTCLPGHGAFPPVLSGTETGASFWNIILICTIVASTVTIFSLLVYLCMSKQILKGNNKNSSRCSLLAE
ncbi:interleukin-13 receptor subunit alpha-2-like isoform X1 [Denticeps clupeoides]|uniref:interleukin-13 receptor subunit alpha-2-like isoform X1 n=1 Tax=Denticeps clupeoides TaxID=299321 RepID=UPI0010A3BF3F|nr:interleukin-13 receptor subunit alpha-2-like isoform X1 [Denticeps clupeoides]XP_028838846.1 interleukin-13 receptor subunit alpha-2-like isoform X1 [Denticeps clupeoides]